MPQANAAHGARYRLFLARTYFLENNPLAALPHIEHALASSRENLDPGHVVAIMAEQMAISAYYQLDQLDRAVEILEKSIELQAAKPESKDYDLFLAYSELGKLLLEIDRPEDAVAAFRRAIALDVFPEATTYHSMSPMDYPIWGRWKKLIFNSRS